MKHDEKFVREHARRLWSDKDRIELWNGSRGDSPRFEFLFRDLEAYGDSLYYYDREKGVYVSDYWSIGD